MRRISAFFSRLTARGPRLRGLQSSNSQSRSWFTVRTGRAEVHMWRHMRALRDKSHDHIGPLAEIKVVRTCRQRLRPYGHCRPFSVVIASGNRMFHCSVDGDTFIALLEEDLKNPTRICAGWLRVKWIGVSCCVETRTPVRPLSSGATLTMGCRVGVEFFAGLTVKDSPLRGEREGDLRKLFGYCCGELRGAQGFEPLLESLQFGLINRQQIAPVVRLRSTAHGNLPLRSLHPRRIAIGCFGELRKRAKSSTLEDSSGSAFRRSAGL